MNILHLADTHLGFSAYRKITAEGVNQREQDIYTSFTSVIDHALEDPPDVIVHAGDLFSSVRPNNRAITHAITQLFRVSEGQIPFVVISGNHEQPKLRETGHIFSILDHIPGIYCFYHEKYEQVSIPVRHETVKIHALPHMNDPDRFEEQIDLIQVDPNVEYNILLAHGSVKGVEEFSMREFDEMRIPQQHLNSQFDYVALGHYHTYTKLSPFAYYAGSIEPLSFAEANTNKGFLRADLTKQRLDVEFCPVASRQMIDAPIIECTGFSVEEIMGKIRSVIQQIEPKDKILRLRLNGILTHQYRRLDFHSIAHWCKNALHYEMKAIIADHDNGSSETHGKIDALSKEYERFISRTIHEDTKTLLKMGLDYINRIEGEKENI